MAHSWTVNEAGVEELCDSDEMTDKVVAPIGQQLADRINDVSPHIGDLRGSWTAHGRQVTTSSSFWHFAEYGTRYSPPYAPVRASMAALRFASVDPTPGAQ